ncbi:MAG: SDR family NAD(P)-dependent oxidoreductase [Planctomycetota bacterium]
MMTDQRQEQARHVFITGVSQGLGFGLAHGHLGAHDVVYGISRRRPNIIAEYRFFAFESADLADEVKARAALRNLLGRVPRLDVVYLNAGVLGAIRDMRDTRLPDLKYTMDVNLWANKVILDEIFTLGIEVDQVVAISSGAAINGSRGWNGYAISKAALNMLMQLYAAEVPKTHFTAFAPGLVDTAMQDYICGLPDDDRFESLKKLKAARGTDHMPEPFDAARHVMSRISELKAEYESGSFVDIRNMT